jgi:DNA-binding response OmpR family regulator
MARILIVEDEERIVSFLTRGLEADGNTVVASGDGVEAAVLATDADFDLMILDIGLPGQDGFAVLSAVRARGETMPVIILTARSGTDDTVAGLNAGADDYVSKPFAFDELLARVRARLRDQSTKGMRIDGGWAILDIRRCVAIVDGREIELSAREFALAEVFFRRPNQVLSREQLLSLVWGYDFEPGSNVVDVYVSYLRKRLDTDRIETVRGVGYRLRAD